MRLTAGTDTAPESPNGLGLVHGPGGCPGFTGGDARQNVRPRSFRELLVEDASQIIIPLFQRKYCWGHEQGVKWFEDLQLPTKRNGWRGCHNTGKAIFKPLQSPTGRTLVCVDGQQRITTTSVLMCAVRDASVRLDDQVQHDAATLRDQISALLMCPGCGTSSSGELPSWKLVPSLADRHTYHQLLSAHNSEALRQQHNTVGPSTGETTNEHLLGMKRTLDECIEGALSPCLGDREKLDVLRRILHQSLDEMYLVSIEIQNDPDLAQVFLWLQEKTLLGMGSLLQNLAPGVEFHSADLVRNILFAPFMRRYGLGSSDLMHVYQLLWLHPIELRAGSSRGVDTAIESCLAEWYADRQRTSKTDAAHTACSQSWILRRSYVSAYEKRIYQTIEWFRSSGVLKCNTAGIEQYARFLTFVDDFTRPQADDNVTHEDAPPPSTQASPEDVARQILAMIAKSCARGT